MPLPDWTGDPSSFLSSWFDYLRKPPSQDRYKKDSPWKPFPPVPQPVGPMSSRHTGKHYPIYQLQGYSPDLQLGSCEVGPDYIVVPAGFSAFIDSSTPHAVTFYRDSMDAVVRFACFSDFSFVGPNAPAPDEDGDFEIEAGTYLIDTHSHMGYAASWRRLQLD